MRAAALDRILPALILLPILVDSQIYGFDLNSTDTVATAASSVAPYPTTTTSSLISNGLPLAAQPSTVLPVVSRVPTTTPVSGAMNPNNSPVSDQTLGIILAASVGGVALLVLIVVLACAFRRNGPNEPYASYSRTPSPMAERPASGTLRAIMPRKLFSSHSANAPEVVWPRYMNGVEGGRRLSHSRRPSSMMLHNAFKAAPAVTLAEVTESPTATPFNRSTHSLEHNDAQSEPRRSRISLSRYHSRSMDIMDAASRYSMDAASERRKSSLNNAERPSQTDLEPLPTQSVSPYSLITPPSPAARNPFFEPASDEAAEAPLIPAKSPFRRQSTLVLYPSWTEVQDFNFEDAESRARRLSRTSDSWWPGLDRVHERHELQ